MYNSFAIVLLLFGVLGLVLSAIAIPISCFSPLDRNQQGSPWIVVAVSVLLIWMGLVLDLIDQIKFHLMVISTSVSPDAMRKDLLRRNPKPVFLESEKNDPEFYFANAKSLFRNGKSEDAAELLQWIINRFPKHDVSEKAIRVLNRIKDGTNSTDSSDS